MSGSPLTVVVAHGSRLAAEGIALALGRFPGVRPVAIATTTAELENLSDGADAIICLDPALETRDGTDVLRTRGVRVISTGSTRSQADVLPADASIEDLASMLLPGDRPGPKASLTAREREVLALVRCGLAAKQVARKLGISPKTVERHKTRIYSKLGVPNQAAAAWLSAFDDPGAKGAPWIRSTM